LTRDKSSRNNARVGGRSEGSVQLVPGALVQYYDEGLRAGHLVSTTSTHARIQPIAAYKAPKPRTKLVKLNDVRPAGLGGSEQKLGNP
jgi:hypothetical protein